jgi:predicted nuclease of predicted toxin-antitoxin system
MKFKLDENIPVDLVRVLGGLGHDVDTVPQEALTGRPDAIVWACAQDAERLLITQDLDFSDLRRYAPGTHDGILLVRLAHPSRRGLLERVGMLFLNEPIEEWQGALVVVTDRKIRVAGARNAVSSEALASPAHRQQRFQR